MHDDRDLELRQAGRTRPNRLYWTAVAVLVVMTVLNFPFWLGGAVGPSVAGLPISFIYHFVFACVAVAVLWLVFTAIWPRQDGPPPETPSYDETTRA